MKPKDMYRESLLELIETELFIMNDDEVIDILRTIKRSRQSFNARYRRYLKPLNAKGVKKAHELHEKFNGILDYEKREEFLEKVAKISEDNAYRKHRFDEPGWE